MKRILLFVCAILVTNLVVAQQRTIKGKVVNEKQEAIANASVYLLTGTAKGILKTTVTTATGDYTFSDYPDGKMIVEVTAVGYAKALSEEFEGKGSAIKLPTITINAKEKEIDAVTVVGELPVIQSKNGKLIMNVENSSISAGNNALEVLKRAPGVNVDKDDNISLMGQQGVNVMIDGRQTYMTGEQLATFLKSTDGSQIKDIELSTNRSAKDDAEGAAGIINIVMKKNRLEGFNGTFLASGAFGKKARGNTSLNMNYKKENTTVFANYSYTNNSTQTNLDLERIIPGKNENTAFDQRAILNSLDVTHSYKVGFEQKTSSRNIFMAQFNASNNVEHENSDSKTLMGPNFTQVDSILNSLTADKKRFNRYSFNANNEFKIDSLGRKLTADIDASFFKTSQFIDYDYRTYWPDMTYKYDPEFEKSDSDVDIKILAGKLDYTQPLWNGVFEAGAKYSNVQSDNKILFSELNNNIWEDDYTRSNTFNYTEQIAAAYLDYARQIKKWGLKAGLRGEYTMSDGHSLTANKRVKRDYMDFFPSASLSYNMNENHVFSFSYARKVTRPNYRYLNPFEYFIDKRTSQRGNPYLNPQYTNGFALNYTLYKMFNVAMGHDITKNAIVESVGQDNETKATWITRDNLGQQTTSYVNLTIPFRLGKVWTMFNNVTGVYMHFKGPIAGDYVDVGSAFIQANSSNNFKITKQFGLELSARYNSKFLYNVYEIQEKVNVDMGASYNFKDQRSSLKLAVTDVFHSNRNNVFLKYGEFDSKIYQYNDSQTVRLTFNYKFGNLKQSVRRKDDSSAEKDRAYN